MTQGSTPWTPGPWLLQGRTVYALDETATTNRFSILINSGYIRDGGRFYNGDRTGEDELDANARLIAAAPELYAALVLVTQRCGPNSSDGAIARAALAKASPSSLSRPA